MRLSSPTEPLSSSVQDSSGTNIIDCVNLGGLRVQGTGCRARGATGDRRKLGLSSSASVWLHSYAYVDRMGMWY